MRMRCERGDRDEERRIYRASWHSSSTVTWLVACDASAKCLKDMGGMIGLRMTCHKRPPPTALISYISI